MKPLTGKVAPEKNPSFSINLKPSRWLVGYLTLLHLLLLAAAALVLADTIAGLMIFSLLLLLHWLYSLWRFGTFFYPAQYSYNVRWIMFRDQGWLLGLANKELSADLTQATVWPWLVVMNFRCRITGRRYAVPVLPDSADPDQRRKLRVLLRHLPVWGDSHRR